MRIPPGNIEGYKSCAEGHRHGWPDFLLISGKPQPHNGEIAEQAFHATCNGSFLLNCHHCNQVKFFR